MRELMTHIEKYNKDIDIEVVEFLDRIELVINTDEFDIADESLHEYYNHYYNEEEKHFKFIYVVGNTLYKLYVAKGIEVFNNIEEPSKRFQMVASYANLSFTVRMIFGEYENRWIKAAPEGCIVHEKEVWVVRSRERIGKDRKGQDEACKDKEMWERQVRTGEKPIRIRVGKQERIGKDR